MRDYVACNFNWYIRLHLFLDKGKSNKFKWYVDQGFNSAEINDSFYRFPTENWINNWKNVSRKNFKFSIKVNRSMIIQG
jgi:uncharacterized protein YecE (DUF72 family)